MISLVAASLVLVAGATTQDWFLHHGGFLPEAALVNKDINHQNSFH
jgi:hypothetical protein